MQVFHGSDEISHPFVGMCLTEDRKAAAHYGCEIAEFFLEVSNLKVVDCNNLVDRDNQDYPGDTNASLAALQLKGVDVAVYIDETACGRSHTTYRLISDAAVASVAKP